MTPRIHLVRHGRPLVDRSVPAHVWPLDSAYADDVRGLARRLPVSAAWFSSPEPKALSTARLLTAEEVTVVDDLRELERDSTEWIADLAGTVRRAFASPGEPAHLGWEPVEECRRRVVEATAKIRAAHPHDDLVLVGHGTAWTVLAAALTGTPPDLDRWQRLGLPDVIVV